MFSRFSSTVFSLVTLMLLGLMPCPAHARAQPDVQTMVYHIRHSQPGPVVLPMPDGAYHLTFQIIKHQILATSNGRPAQHVSTVIAQAEGIGCVDGVLHVHGPWLDAVGMNCELVVHARPLYVMPGWRPNALLPEVRRVWLGPAIPKYLLDPNGGIFMPNDGHGFDGFQTPPVDDEH